MTNKLLRSLTSTHSRRFIQNLSTVHCTSNQVLAQPGQQCSMVYFPLSAVLSLIAVVDGRRTVQVASVGTEGFVGLPFMASIHTTPVRIVCHIPGAVAAMSAQRFTGLLRDTSVRTVFDRYAQRCLTAAYLNIACVHSHSIKARFARLLLTLQDQTQRKVFLSTQDNLATLLGVQRPGLNAVATSLKKMAIIDYSRGKVVILDRMALQRSVCSCYRVFRRIGASS